MKAQLSITGASVLSNPIAGAMFEKWNMGEIASRKSSMDVVMIPGSGGNRSLFTVLRALISEDVFLLNRKTR